MSQSQQRLEADKEALKKELPENVLAVEVSARNIEVTLEDPFEQFTLVLPQNFAEVYPLATALLSSPENNIKLDPGTLHELVAQVARHGCRSASTNSDRGASVGTGGSYDTESDEPGTTDDNTGSSYDGACVGESDSGYTKSDGLDTTGGTGSGDKSASGGEGDLCGTKSDGLDTTDGTDSDGKSASAGEGDVYDTKSDDGLKELLQDVEEVRAKYGAEWVEWNVVPPNRVLVTLRLDYYSTGLLSPGQCKEWGLAMPSERVPVLIELRFEREGYVNAPFELSVKQCWDGRPSGGWRGFTEHLARILKAWAKDMWEQQRDNKIVVETDGGSMGGLSRVPIRRIDESGIIDSSGSSKSVAEAGRASAGGYLARLLGHALYRAPICNEFCVACDKPHMGTVPLAATVCRGSCAFGFLELKADAAAAKAVAGDILTTELLVCMARAAAAEDDNAAATGCARLLEPFPSVGMPPPGSKKKVLDTDASVARRLFAGITLEHIAFPTGLRTPEELLAQWAAVSLDPRITRLTSPTGALSSLSTPHQYYLHTASSPTSQTAFADLKQQHGTTFAWLGAPFPHWHRILRLGLRAVPFLPSLRLSPDTAVSYPASGIFVDAGFDSSRGGPPDADLQPGMYLDSRGLRCIALCEVIDDGIKKAGNVWVQQSDRVVVRFLFVFDEYNRPDRQLSLLDKGFMNEVRKCAAHSAWCTDFAT